MHDPVAQERKRLSATGLNIIAAGVASAGLIPLTRRMAHCVLCSAPGPHRSSGSVRPFASQFQTGADGYPNLFSHSR
jgi:hypothetical protein